MYYSSGNYEAFARPAKPEGIEDKSAYIVGTGLAGLSAACYLIRDAQMDGSRVHLFERDAEPGGACDGWEYPQLGFTMRGGREMDNHFEVMWDLFRSIPSIEDENMSILDYYYQLNKRDPNYSLCRATVNRGEDAGLDNTFNLSDKACMEIMNLFFTPEEQLDDKPITDYFSDDVLDSNFWLYWRTMFAFESWHSALEMKRYIQRFVHHVGGLPDFSALRFTRYNQFESLILPMVNYLKGQGVQIHLNTEVVDITFSSTPERKVATEVQTICEGAPTRRFTSPTTTCCSSPTAAASPTRPSDRKTSRPSSTPCWKREPDSTCGGVSPGRIPSFGTSRKVHRRSGEVQLDERHRHDARREDRSLYREAFAVAIRSRAAS